MREVSYCTFNLVMASRSVIVVATVLSIRENVCYPCCSKCHRRVRTQDQQRFWCELCREEYNEEQVQYRYRVSVLASDRTQLAQIIVFGSCLNKFFGGSATDFKRFVANLNHKEIALPCSWLVKLAIDQCFIGSTLRFGFRVRPAFGRTTSQIARNSPFHLKNIFDKQPMTINRTRQFEDVPNLLAYQVVRCSSSDESPTVLETLDGYLNDLSNDRLQLLEFPAGVKLECSTSNLTSNCKTCLTYKSPFTQRLCSSPICCSAPHVLCGSLAQSPLVLTVDSQPTSGEMTTQGENSKDVQDSCLFEQSDYMSFFQEEKQDSLETLQRMEGVFSSAPTEDSEELPLSPRDESYFMDFPSSEDLSAFLADVVLDENVLNNDDVQSVLSLDSIKGGTTAHVVTLEGLTTNQDYSEFVEFPSLEELDAFLADIETDCSDVSVQRAFNSGTSRWLNDSNGNGNKSALQGVSAHPYNEMMNRDKTYKDTEPHHYRCELTRTTTKSQAIRDGQNMVEFSQTKCKGRLPENFLANTVSSCCSFPQDNETASRGCSKGASVMLRDNKLTDSQHVLSDIKRRGENQKQSVALHTSSKLGFLRKHRQSKLQQSEECNEEMRIPFDLCETRKQIVQCNAILTLENSLQTHLRSSISRSPVRIQTEEPRPSSSRHLLTLNQENTHAPSRSPCEKNTINSSEVECLQCSPELFSQSYTREEKTFSKTPDLFSPPRICKDHEQSYAESECCNTPDLFSLSEDSVSDRIHSCARRDLDSLSLFSNSCSSCVSWASSPDYQPQQKRLALEKDVKKNFDLTNSCHSTPVTVLEGLPSVRSLSRLWTPSKCSPLVVRSVSGKWNDDVSFQGTPSLFSQISNSAS